MHRLRRLLWRKLTKVDSKLKMASTMHKKSKLLAEKWKLERQLAEDYTATNNAEEDEVVLRHSLALPGPGRLQEPRLDPFWILSLTNQFTTRLLL